MIFHLFAFAISLALVPVTYANPAPWGAASNLQVPQKPRQNSQNCTVYALGNQQDDTTQILAAFKQCNNGGTVIFPEGQNYWIATRLNPVLYDVHVECRGVWTVLDNLTYWRNNSYPIAFQNHHAGFVITGDRININGHGTGGIHGNGNAWYNVEHGTTQPGRPMPFVWWKVSDVYVSRFFIKDPPLWSINIMNSTNMWFDHMIANATANTDGFDTMDAKNIRLTNMVYQGGDDCIAIKPRSYNIYITCHGGNGIAIGSLGQYLEDSSVINVLVKDANILTHNNDMTDSAYIKTWVGALVPQPNDYESDYLPRGGGWGVVQNIRFENFWVQGASIGPATSEDSGDNGSYAGTSKMEISNIAFVNFTGYTQGGKGNQTASISCSKIKPCYNIALRDISLATSANGTEHPPQGTCPCIALGGVSGLNGTGC